MRTVCNLPDGAPSQRAAHVATVGRELSSPPEETMSEFHRGKKRTPPCRIKHQDWRMPVARRAK
ncbi:hypothetical protein SBA3_1040022 [Candidatus Sulfopaludibacter sp. SbA3]|nr:hypothetical protein SBA3_1040022 [Candidatus Sulfopaludibacter sp. SbA3]